MPNIDLSEATFKRLQALAKPLIDTPSTVIDRLIDHYEDAGEGTDAPAANGKDPVAMITFDPAEVPSLTHTKLRKASFGGRELCASELERAWCAAPSKPDWNGSRPLKNCCA